MIGPAIEEIQKAFQAEFPSFQVLSEYPRSMAGLRTPALIFELVSADAAEKQPATGELDLETSWEARLILGGKSNASHRIMARKAALKLATFLHGNFLGIPCSMPARVVRMMDDGSDPNVPTLEVWVVEWSQLMRVGRNLNDDGSDWLPERVHILRGEEETTYPPETP